LLALVRWGKSCLTPADTPVFPIRAGVAILTEPARDRALASGTIDLDPGTIDLLPDSPGHYRLRTSGQRVILAGHAGEEGLRSAVRSLWRTRAVAGVSTIDYAVEETAEAAAEAAARDIAELRPLYNEGLNRYRNPDRTLPTTGRRTRRAMHHP